MPEPIEPHQVVSQLLDTLSAARDFDVHGEQEIKDFRTKHAVSEYAWHLVEKQQRRTDRKRTSEADDNVINMLRRRSSEEITNNFIDAFFKGATSAERELIAEQIGKELLTPDVCRDYSLADMVRGGLQAVRSKHRRRHLKYLKHSWTATKGFTSIFLVLAVYARIEAPFEIIVCSLLLLVYTNLRRYIGGVAIAGASFNQAGFIRYIELKKELKMKEPSSDEYEALWSLEKTVKDGIAHHFVVDVAHSIINFIVFWNLIKILF